ncbi:hypothetical protein IE4803_CH02487 [Rhizobium etli bv. phaseoli str. IE4803]|nr:hypothetical protein IE4803_CH02487 [Rhizobium etli bv. phaseoli str. IE4803]
MKPAQFEQPSRRADRSNRQTVITHRALSSNSGYMLEGSDRAIFPESVIFIQQFQLLEAKNAQNDPATEVFHRKPLTPNSFIKILTARSSSDIVVKLIKHYRRLMNTHKVAA